MTPRAALALLPLLLLLPAQTGPVAPPLIRVTPPSAPPPPPPPRQGSRPQPIDVQSWIRPEDYPVAALREWQEGRVRIGYRVRTDGRVGDCTVLVSSGHPALDEASCALLVARARYRPARDGRGRPVEAAVQQPILWRIPDMSDPVPFRPGWVRLTLPVMRDGVAACREEPSDPALEGLAADMCIELFPDGHEAARAVAARPFTALVTLGPPGRPRPLAAPAEPLTAVEASFGIGEEGDVRACSEIAGRSAGRSPFGLCDFLTENEEPYFEAQPGAGPRRARMTIETFPPAPPR